MAPDELFRDFSCSGVQVSFTALQALLSTILAHPLTMDSLLENCPIYYHLFSLTQDIPASCYTLLPLLFSSIYVLSSFKAHLRYFFLHEDGGYYSYTHTPSFSDSTEVINNHWFSEVFLW